MLPPQPFPAPTGRKKIAQGNALGTVPPNNHPSPAPPGEPSEHRPTPDELQKAIERYNLLRTALNRDLTKEVRSTIRTDLLRLVDSEIIPFTTRLQQVEKERDELKRLRRRLDIQDYGAMKLG